MRPRFRFRRWDLILAGAASLAFSAATTPASAYFLHLDMPNQDFAALAWARGCWEYTTEKMVGVFLLAPLFRLFGPSTVFEPVLLAILAAVTAAAVYELARLLGRSRRAGVLAALLVTALPAHQYFSRTHIGYALPCLMLAWLAVWHKRWAWAGLAFGLLVIAHFGYGVITAVSVAALAAFFLRPGQWRNWLALGLAGLAPLLAVEALFFAYLGRPMQWTQGVLVAGQRWSGAGNGLSADPHWAWALEAALGSNGWAFTAALGLSLFSAIPLRRNATGLALVLSGLFSVAAFTLAAVRHEDFIARPLAPLFPLAAVGSAVAVEAVAQRLGDARLRYGATALVVAGLAAGIVHTGQFVRRFTETTYPAVAGWMRQAAAANQPLRYDDVWVSLYYATVYGGEVLTGDGRWIENNAPGQAVLIFDEAPPPGLSADGYTVESVDVPASADGLYPTLTREAGLPRHSEVWWPAGPSAPLRPEGGLPLSAHYYAGAGCLTAPPFGDGTLYFYQLAWRKLLGGLSN